MNHNVISPEISFAPEHESGTKTIWRTFWLLSLLTVIELALGLWIYNINKGVEIRGTLILFIKGVVCILTLAKAYYIVSVFMHLGSEVRNMIMTIVVPLCLFIWFIIAFLWDGNAWRNLRNSNAGAKPDTEQVPPAQHRQGEKP